MYTVYKATVRWFDNLSQEGMIRLPDGTSVYVNNDPVHGYLLNGGKFNGLFSEHTKGKPFDLKGGDEVIVQVYTDITFRQVSRMAVCRELDALQQDNLLRSYSGQLIGE